MVLEDPGVAGSCSGACQRQLWPSRPYTVTTPDWAAVSYSGHIPVTEDWHVDPSSGVSVAAGDQMLGSVNSGVVFSEVWLEDCVDWRS